MKSNTSSLIIIILVLLGVLRYSSFPARLTLDHYRIKQIETQNTNMHTEESEKEEKKKKHTHTHIYIYIYIYEKDRCDRGRESSNEN